jgi:predicted alpha/beta superfamily hydrolase
VIWRFAVASIALSAIYFNEASVTAAAPAMGHGAAPFPAEVSIPNTRRVDFVSKVNGHRYAISVALPFVRAPAKGYGVLYVLDGFAYFASATEAARLFNASDVVVVGIGYPEDSAFVRTVMERRGPAAPGLSVVARAQQAALLERVYDFTLPASEQTLVAEAWPGSTPPRTENVGGLDTFLKVIEVDIKPRIAAMVSIDSSNQALFGHSLGGLAALHALFAEPNAFRTFIIASPSIWWNNRAVLADESKFAAAVDSGQASPRVLVTAGSEESDSPTTMPHGWGAGLDPAAVEASVRKARMVANGEELVRRLKTIHGTGRYFVEDYAVFDKQNHTISPWPALARAIPFAFPSTP